MVNIIPVDIAEDIDFIHIAEDVGIIGGGNGFSHVCFRIRSTAPVAQYPGTVDIFAICGFAGLGNAFHGLHRQ